MRADLNELAGILRQQQELFQRYVDHLALQQECLVRNDLGGARACADQVNDMAAKAKCLDDGRRQVVARLSEASDSHISIPALLKKLDGAGLEELMKLRDKMLEAHEKIACQKAKNELLIGQSMRIIRQAMECIRDVDNLQSAGDNHEKDGEDRIQEGCLQTAEAVADSYPSDGRFGKMAR